jgi:hypothetical protein
VTEMFACRMSSCTTFTSSPLPLRSVAYVWRLCRVPDYAEYVRYGSSLSLPADS